jgi:CheY-specific phosphatase CheX
MLTESIFEVFEKMLFTFLEPSEEPAPVFDLETAIHYDGGALTGEIRLLLSRELAASMASNLLGLGMDRVTESCAEDCAKEAVNMICGNFLDKFDRARAFNLSMPALVRPVSGGFDQRAGRHRKNFDSDHGKVGVVLTMSGA